MEAVNTWTALAFIIGGITSLLSGYIGMMAATKANSRTTIGAWTSLENGFIIALRGGSIMGLALSSLGVGSLLCVILYFQRNSNMASKDMFEAIAGYGLGGSSIALFGRVGGGIYTKAADIGADLSGKNKYGMNEDDPRNPACIADNVGDNVGDVAGMGADLFGSFAESTCAALVIAGSSNKTTGISTNFGALLYPLCISAIGIGVGIITILYSTRLQVNTEASVEISLKKLLLFSTAIMTPCVPILSWTLLPNEMTLPNVARVVSQSDCSLCVLAGLWGGLAIGYVTEYYTSHAYSPVRNVSSSYIQSTATGIIFGLALGYVSAVIPVMCLMVVIVLSYVLAGSFGVALGALGMLSTMSVGLTIDAYGPISDNAGGIAEMCELGPEIRKRTDALDAAGNTTAAIGKGFAIGSAALVSLALFSAYTVRAEISTVNLLDPWTFAGLLYGAMMPYWFSAMTMKSVGNAACAMVDECHRQFKKIIEENAAPDYDQCISISTDASLKEMIAPGLLVMLSPVVAGMAFGKNCTAGLLCGSLVSGVQLAISMSNSGGAWDNAKKYIESGALGSEHLKGSETHKAAVTGDTVGDPLKDTSGPSLNIVVKLSAIISLVFGSFLNSWSNSNGGPFWLQ